MADQQPQLAVVPYQIVSIPNVLNYTKQMKVVALIDRHLNPPQDPQEWLFQTDLEDLLYYQQILSRPPMATGTSRCSHQQVSTSTPDVRPHSRHHSLGPVPTALALTLAPSPTLTLTPAALRSL